MVSGTESPQGTERRDDAFKARAYELSEQNLRLHTAACQKVRSIRADEYWWNDLTLRRTNKFLKHV